MEAPATRPAPSKSISTNLPKREELSLREVLALPNASSSGLDSSTCGGGRDRGGVDCGCVDEWMCGVRVGVGMCR